ncbi:MAG TPA: TadE/TadG family type IV pilus assembly protein [Candidatus Limnocylindrales bacterium]|nr:TadE/TadG family type IV pilus assembly protein [Candidatus Limnocylindrales bacterium]
MAEFALVLTPLFLLLLGILQMGLVLNAYVTISNATREGARTATIYLYDRGLTKTANDANRLSAAQSATTSSMGLLKKTAPQFSTATDFVLSYALCNSGGTNCVAETDTRTGQYVTVRITYHQDLVIPLISSVLPKDGGGRMPLTAEVTMVVN